MNEYIQLTQRAVRDNGVLRIQENSPEPWDRVFIFRHFRFIFALNNTPHAPADLTDSDGDGIPDYIIKVTHQLAVAYTLYSEGLGLQDIMQSGILYDQGARCICIYLSDIPVEHGIASAQVLPCTSSLFHEDGPALNGLKLTLHRGLHKNTLTPAHELFHLFQYSYTPFNNVWFMEGLARWSQRLFQTHIPTTEPLPSNTKQLNHLLKKWHDAEFFWNRLTSLCSKRKMSIPQTLVRCGIPINANWIDGCFMRMFFQQIETELGRMRTEQKTRALPTDNNWGRIEKRSANNNKYILRAITSTIKLISPRPHGELETFLSLVEPITTSQTRDYFSDINIQSLMHVLNKLKIGKVLSTNGILYSDYYDPHSRTLSIQSITIDGDSVSNADLETFRNVTNIIGNLKISNNHSLTDLSGLDRLDSIEGDLILDNTGVVSLHGLNLLERVKGTIKVVNNTRLTTISGFTSLDVVDQELVIADNPELRSMSGFNTLRLIKKGGLSILRCNKLSSIVGFVKLVQAKNIWFYGLQITHIDFLETLFKKQSRFPGFIKIESCRVSQVRALRGITSTDSSLYLHANHLTNLEGLENLSSVGASLSLSNNKLSDISQLQRLVKINGMLGLAKNNLTTLHGLENLAFLKTVRWGNQIRTLLIHGNPKLSDIASLANVLTDDRYLTCHTDDPTQYLSRPAPQSNFHKNILELHDTTAKRITPTYAFIRKNSHDYTYFRRTTHNKTREFLVDLETDSDTLVLSFSGLNGNLGGMFYNRFPLLTENFKTHKIFINDTRRLWYHGGIRGFTQNIQQTLDHLAYISTRKRYNKIICVGTSMGGYMSLLAGYIIKATHIVAFAPQVFLDEHNRKLYGDTRWAKSIQRFSSGIPEQYLDLRLLYKSRSNTSSNIQIHYGSRLLLDKTHVEHLGMYDNIQLHEYDINDHYITTYLDKQGRLMPLIENILAE